MEQQEFLRVGDCMVYLRGGFIIVQNVQGGKVFKSLYGSAKHDMQFSARYLLENYLKNEYDIDIFISNTTPCVSFTNKKSARLQYVFPCEETEEVFDVPVVEIDRRVGIPDGLEKRLTIAEIKIHKVKRDLEFKFTLNAFFTLIILFGMLAQKFGW